MNNKRDGLFYLYSRNRDVLANKIISVLPDAVCVNPIIIDKDTNRPVSKRLITPIMNGINLCWRSARRYGMSSIVWKDTEVFINRSNTGYRMYGIPDDLFNVGYPVLSEDVWDAICNYRLIKKHLQQRVRNSYAQMMIFGGEVAHDMGDETYQAISDKFQTNDRLISAPIDSSLDSINIPLTDLDKISPSFYEQIAIEAGLPLWLIDSSLASSTFTLEDKSIFLRSEFERNVEPVINYLFQSRGFDVTVYTPSYRDLAYLSALDNTDQDTDYKQAAEGNLIANKKATELNTQQQKKIESKDIVKSTGSTTVKKPNKGRML